MPTFAYEALDKGGKQVKGVIDAQSEEAIIEKLRGMGFYPTRVAQHRESAGEFDISTLPILRTIFHRVKTKHVSTFTRQLATLIDAGLPIVRSLAILEDQVESVVFRDKIHRLSQDIESGASLSEAMSKHPRVFDKLYVNMVRAGEIGGVLETVLTRIAEFLEKRQALKGKVKSAMTYPLVVMVLASGIVGFILVKILPRFAEIFTQLNAELPWLTQQLINASDILITKTHYLVIGGFAVYFATKHIYRVPQGKFLIDAASLRIFVVGALLRKLAIARFAGTLSTLISAGVPILQAIDIVRDTSGNEVITRAMDRVYQSVKDGETIHEPLSRCSVFPPLVVHMVAVGEETGAIDQMLIKVAEAYEREVDDTVNALTSILEPVMIVFLGIVVGTIVVALYYPLFMLPSIAGR